MHTNQETQPATTAARPPLVSVIVPMRNAAETIDDQLAALAGQDYRGDWECILSDNGSRDDSVARARAWTRHISNLQVVDSSRRRGPAHARNVALSASAGRLVLLCDADDVVSPGWITAMTTALAQHQLVSGPLLLSQLNPLAQHEWSDAQRAELEGRRTAFGFRSFPATCNVGARKSVFETVGVFNEKLHRGEDMDFGWRAAEHGVQLHFEPNAIVFRRLRWRPREVFVEGIRDGLHQPLLYATWRHHGMQRESVADALRHYRNLAATVPGLIAAGDASRGWAYEVGARLGRVAGSAYHRHRYL